MLLEEVMNFKARMFYTDLGHMRTKVTIVDVDTGEIVSEYHLANALQVFESGANVVIASIMWSREKLPNGAIHNFLKDPKTGFQYAEWWEGKKKHKHKPKITQDEADAGASGKVEERPQEEEERKPKHTGGKPSYVKLMSEGFEKNLAKLEDSTVGFLSKLSQNTDWETGVVVDKRSKKPLGTDGIAELTNNSRATAYRRLTALKTIDALTVTPEGYFILSREYVQKG